MIIFNFFIFKVTPIYYHNTDRISINKYKNDSSQLVTNNQLNESDSSFFVLFLNNLPLNQIYLSFIETFHFWINIEPE